VNTIHQPFHPGDLEFWNRLYGNCYNFALNSSFADSASKILAPVGPYFQYDEFLNLARLGMEPYESDYEILPIPPDREGFYRIGAMTFASECKSDYHFFRVLQPADAASSATLFYRTGYCGSFDSAPLNSASDAHKFIDKVGCSFVLWLYVPNQGIVLDNKYDRAADIYRKALRTEGLARKKLLDKAYLAYEKSFNP